MTTDTVLNLEKGQRINLTKDNAGLKKIRVGLSWDVKPGIQADADASCICLGENDKMVEVKSLVFFGNYKETNKYTAAIKHSGDNLTGDGDGDDETITVDLSLVPADVKSLLFSVTMYSHGSKTTFGMVKNCTCRLYNADTNEVIAKFDLSEDFSTATALEMAKLYRHESEWKAEAIGLAAGTSNNGLEDVIAKYKNG